MSRFPRNCRQVTRLVLEGEHRRLAFVERVGVRLHLGICTMCARFTRQMRLMDEAMARWKADGDSDDGPGDPRA